VAGWQEIIRTSREERIHAEQEAARKRDLAADLRGQQREALREADDCRRTAGACRGEIGDVVGGGSVDEAMPLPQEALESLRAAYRSAAVAYERVEVGVGLRAEVDRLERAESEARAALESIDHDVRDRAAGLLLTPDGSDMSARAEAAARSQRLVAALEERVTAAAERAGELKQAFENYQPQERSLEP